MKTALMILAFIFWSGEIRVREVGPNGLITWKTEYGLFRGDTETGEVKELVRYRSGRKGGTKHEWEKTRSSFK